jgi:LysR family transcriptional regulator, regulator for bpeEF and oprC
VLSQWKPSPLPISAVYPHNRHLSPTVRVFVDWVAELFGRCPLFSGQEDAEQRCLPTTAPEQAPAVRRGAPVSAAVAASAGVAVAAQSNTNPVDDDLELAV